MLFHELLSGAREAKGLSCRKLSLECGMSDSYFSKVEAGKIVPSVVAFARASEVLGLSRVEILVLLNSAKVIVKDEDA